MKQFLFSVVFLGFASALMANDDAQRAKLAFFEKEVRPLLIQHCYECHGPKTQENSLRLDHGKFVLQGGDGGPAIVPGKPAESLLIKAIGYADADLQMPPDEKLPQAAIDVLTKWVEMGAPWPAETAPVVAEKKDGFTDEDRNYWFFQPLANVTPPAVSSPWVKGDIDCFIAQKQAEVGVSPSPEASREELIRRVYFDLHGLPPSPADVAAFCADRDERAYEKLVERLLASPRYGERWAQHWLDLVRYSESDGYNADGYRESVWPYRDYVIRSLNEDKPYDQFVREQLAGDELAPDDPNVMIATAYLRHPVYEWNQRDVRGQWELIVTDMTDTTGELFLGLSMGCARCHDHKFDPILQKDYYRLKAFFTPVLWRDDLKLGTPQQVANHAEQLQAWEAATVDVRVKMEALTTPLLEPKVEKALARFTDDLQAMVRMSDNDRTALDRQLAGLCVRQMVHERRTFDAMKTLKSAESKAEYKALEAELKKFDAIKPKALLDAFVATDASSVAPPNIMKTRRGEEQVEPGFLTLLEAQPPTIQPREHSTGRRTVLANWITRPDNQLATRVIVNRIWQYHFGRGIVATASDFGRLGEKPTHPELLDWLATRFVASGWSIKKLHKDILLSAAYQQTAHVDPAATAMQIDPTNKYLWRFCARRLDAEQARDAMLAASGELDFKAGGPAEDANSTRRSIYTRKKRNSQNELLRSLDAPAGFSSTAERQSTTTPTQALLLMNGDWTLARARKLAQRAKTIDDAWMLALGRHPTERELATAKAFFQRRSATNAPASDDQVAANTMVGKFHENSPHERLVADLGEKEGDEFTVEAIIELGSIDTGSSPRTIVSRSNGAKDNIEAFGWSLCVTGKKSRYKPQSLIVQLVGEDENANIAYEVAPSDIRIDLNRSYHVAATVSCAERTVTFQVRDLSKPDAHVQTAVTRHSVQSKLSSGQSPLVIGGLSKRSPVHQWHGQIAALRVVKGRLPAESLSPDPNRWSPGLAHWIAAAEASSPFTWTGADSQSVESSDAYRQAMNDLCQVLLNSNEFLYLH